MGLNYLYICSTVHGDKGGEQGSIEVDTIEHQNKKIQWSTENNKVL